MVLSRTRSKMSQAPVASGCQFLAPVPLRRIVVAEAAARGYLATSDGERATLGASADLPRDGYGCSGSIELRRPAMSARQGIVDRLYRARTRQREGMQQRGFRADGLMLAVPCALFAVLFIGDGALAIQDHVSRGEYGFRFVWDIVMTVAAPPLLAWSAFLFWPIKASAQEE